MTKAVFQHKADSIYDDTPWEKYNFPKLYLSRVEQTVGDWIVYYEPRSAEGGTGRLAYFATGQVQTVIPDPSTDGRYYALIMPGTYLPFDRAVARAIGGQVIEGSLRRSDGSLASGGYAQSAVRLIADTEFDTILSLGFTSDPVLLGLDQAPETIDGFADEQLAFKRPVVEQITNRPFREAAFARQVKIAYRNRCAVTGLCLRNGGGRPEVQAAHIRPVADDGPDTVRNGLALSGTVHWMFDRGLISVDEDHSILVAEDRVPADTVKRLIVPERRLLLPGDPRALPHPAYLKYHREQVFKG
jgi:putative restriction endonuclease